MKKFTALILLALITFTIFTGCSKKSETSTPDEATTTATTAATEPPTTAPQPTTVPATTAPPATEPPQPTLPDYATQYLSIIDDYEYTYGIGDRESLISLISPYGLYYARLVDFDYSGIPELIIGYFENGPLYSIYAMVDGEAVCVDSGKMHTTGGPDPSIILAFTDSEIYFITGRAQAYSESNYRSFNGSYFETVFSCGGDLDGNYYINGETTTEEDYNYYVDSFRSNIIDSDSFRLSSDYDTTIATIDNTRYALWNS